MTERPKVLVTITHQIPEEQFTRNEIPSRSKLYGLVPCGLGTVWQESLTSYLNRLAWHHHVPPQHLVAQEIVPLLNHSYSRQQLSAFSWSTAMSVNGNGSLAQEWASILERLTKRSDLRVLTFQWWVGDLPPHKLLREKPAWCPACYAEWKDQGMPIYEPLLWMLSTVKICMKHLCKLEEYCPGCERRQSLIRVQTALDECTRCKTWLGSPTSALVPLSPETVEWQRWVIYALEELRSAMASSALPPWEQFFTNLSRSCEARREQSRLAELAGLAPRQFARWLNRSQTPILESILEFCYVCNVTPLQILLGDLAPLKQIIAEDKPFRPLRSRRLYRLVDREQCLERIQAVLDGQEKPRGYRSLAQQLGYHQNALRYHFPAESALLSKQVKEYRQQQAEQRAAQIKEEIQQTVMELHAQGVYPSHRKVLERIAHPTLMRNPKARAFRLALCRDLGWN